MYFPQACRYFRKLLIPQMDSEQQHLRDLQGKAFAAADSRDFERAVDLYDQCLAIRLEEEDKLSQSTLLNQRAQANLNLSRFELAVDDSIAALACLTEHDGEESIRNRRLAFLTAGQGFYGMRSFKKASEYVQAAEKIEPTEGSAGMLGCIQGRLAEETEGSYDFEKMLEELIQNPMNRELDHASFISNTNIGITPNCGRGLFATKDFHMGDLVLCEKAFAVHFPAEILSDQFPDLSSKVVQLLKYSPARKDEFYNLTDGVDAPARHPGQFSFPKQVRDMVGCNAFRFNSVSTWHGMEQRKRSGPQDTEGSEAIWTRASLFNHSCLSNVHRSHIGDMMVVRAVKPIKKGEELFIAYLNTSQEYQQRKALTSMWNFECSCKRCQADAASADRKQLVDEADAFLDGISANGKPLGPGDLKEAKRRLQSLRSTYSGPAYQGIPHLPLIDLGRFLAEDHLLTNMTKAEQTIVSLFMDLGFAREGSKGELVFDLAGAPENPQHSLEVALLAARVMHMKKTPAHKEVFITLSKRLYLVSYGAMHGFENCADPNGTGWLSNLDAAYR